MLTMPLGLQSHFTMQSALTWQVLGRYGTTRDPAYACLGTEVGVFLYSNIIWDFSISVAGTGEKKFGMIFNSPFFLPVHSWSIPIPAHH